MAAGTPRQSIDHYVGASLRSLREACGMDLTEVGSRIGSSDEIIASYNGANSGPLPTDTIALAGLYGVRLSDLFPEDPSQLTGRLD